MSTAAKPTKKPVQVSTRTFYKKTFVYEVLSEEPIGDVSLKDIEDLCGAGPCSGRFVRCQERTLNGRQAARALEAQGSSPSFFQLTDKGEDADA